MASLTQQPVQILGISLCMEFLPYKKDKIDNWMKLYGIDYPFIKICSVFILDTYSKYLLARVHRCQIDGLMVILLSHLYSRLW